MKTQTHTRLRNSLATRPLLDSLEPRLLLSSAHSHPSPAFAPLASPAVVITANTPPTLLVLLIQKDLSFKGAFKDKDKTDFHNISVNWDDGTSSLLPLSAGKTKFTLPRHDYTTPGIYNAIFTVTDPDNASASATLIFEGSDLVPSLKSALSISNSLITGITTTATVSVLITNNGFADSPAATVSIFLRPNAGGNDINITPTPANIPSIKSSKQAKGRIQHAGKTVNVDIDIPTTLAPGAYSVVIKIADGETLSAAVSNNTLIVPNFTLTATLGSVSISTGLTLNKFPSTIVQGTKVSGTVAVTLTNNGNIPTPTPGQYDVALVAQPASGSPIPILSKPGVVLHIIQPNGGTASFSAPLSLSADATALLPLGTYTFVATLTPVNGTTGGVITITGPTLTITAASTNPGGTSLLKHGDTIKFTSNTQLTGGNFLEFGNFEIGAHVTGSYTFNPSGLTLNYSTGDSDTLLFTFTAAQVFLDPTLDGNPTTVTFSAAPISGKTAFADVTINSSTTLDFATYA